MVFDARAATEKAKAEHPPYEFTGLDGETYTLPNPWVIDPVEVKAKTGVDAESVGELDEEASIHFLEAMAPEAWKAIQDMLPAVQKDLIEDWQVTTGFGDEGKESSPSSGRNRAERRSKRTSRSGGSTSSKRRSTS